MAVLDNGVWYPNKDVHELLKEDSFHLPKVPEAGRYHLYMSLACPFAHRPYLVINYLGLGHVISVSSVAAKRYADGWIFDDEHPDEVNNTQGLVELYQKANPVYSGRVTVPVLWDKHQDIIVGDDSSSMAMDLATKWLHLAKNKIELVPENLREEITSLNDWLHQHVNRKVYHVGFAPDQATYDTASDELFNALEQLNIRLGKSRYLHGGEVTLSDLFLIPTLVRFEAVYEVHFKANKKLLKSFEHLYRYMLELVSISNIRETVDLDYMKLHYYFSHRHINPTGIVPAGPDIAW
ncbi:MAG: glutathione S-transferase C-terminal domain-containing protein [Moritella sp.]|uniref:glutathione S-transferase C-terminal domain-containing protein n=1 Tax=Moritella sp. TaxID=78556 RepID=UPI0025E57BE7|nr:glutathione S-transferase C-terminal domain-containing protein [Moritella sp.]NQZ91513.1 glutathione S-transferase C-terminal domain-containing protein [Moritella sp.]